MTDSADAPEAAPETIDSANNDRADAAAADVDTTSASTIDDTAASDYEPTAADYAALVAELESQGAEQEPDPSNAEAAKWRSRLRSAETELGYTQERLETLQRREIERIAAGRLASGQDVWAGGIELDQCLDEHGDVDPGLVERAVARILQERPHWAQPRPRTSGLRSGASSAPDVRSASWASALRHE